MLKHQRTKAKLTQEELAKFLGVSFATVNRWERGHHEPLQVLRELVELKLQQLGK